MTFDPAKVPGGDVAAWGAECREKALVGVRDGDWRSIHGWTKSGSDGAEVHGSLTHGSCTPSRRFLRASPGVPSTLLISA